MEQSDDKDSGESKEPGDSFGEDQFTEKEMLAAWKDFAASRKKEGKDSEYTVMDQPVRLKDDHTILLSLTNAVKLNILDRFRSDLILHLKKTLNNRHIKLESEMLEEEQSYKPYTPKEKLAFLIEKKPVLKELKDRLGLDPDY